MDRLVWGYLRVDRAIDTEILTSRRLRLAIPTWWLMND